jgi:hypothetical protein
MTMLDRERLEELKARLKDKYTAVELCELLGLTEDDLLEQFEEQVMEVDWDGE